MRMVRITTKLNREWVRTTMAILLIGWKGERKKRALPAENLKVNWSSFMNCSKSTWEHVHVPVYAQTFGNNDECPLVSIVGIDITDGDAGELHGKFAIPLGKVVACSLAMLNDLIINLNRAILVPASNLTFGSTASSLASSSSSLSLS